MPIVNRVAELADEIAGWRRHLHAHPELAYEEVETAAFVARTLAEAGVDEIHERIGKTGVVGVLRAGSGGRSIGLRADMDALPIHEATGAPYASTAAGKMHACGHDGHTAMLLGAARYLAETRNFDGTVFLVFQPAEEGFSGGQAMMDDGLFERFPAERIFGMHNWPWLPVGSFAMCKGPAMAAADRFQITVTGRGCHAAMPNQGRDPIVAGSLMIQAFQSLVAREVDPLDNAVVSVTRVAGGEAFNVIPDEVEMIGTVRTFKEATQAMIERRMGEIVAGIAQAQGVEADFSFMRGYPATLNADAEADLGADTAAEIVGEPKVSRSPQPSMGAEDFAFMLEARPGSYVWVGSGGAEEGRVLHSATFDFDDATIPYGVSYWARLVERLLPRG